MSYRYNQETGEVFRDEELIAMHDAEKGETTYEEGKENYRLPIAKAIKAATEPPKEPTPSASAAPAPPEPDIEIPARPKMNPRYGDKTPDLVRWLKEHDHDEYVQRYGIVREGVEIDRYNSEGEYTGKETVDIGSRRVVGVEVTAETRSDTEYDWDSVTPTETQL